MEDTQEKQSVAVGNYFFNLFNGIKNSTLYSNAFFLSMKSLSNAILGFLFWNLMARTFTPAQVGIGSSLIAASSLIGVLANLGLGTGLIRFVPEVGDKAKQLINAAFTLSVLVSIIGATVFLAGLDWWAPALVFLRDRFYLLVLFVLFTVATTLAALTDDTLVAGRAAQYVFWKNMLINMLKLPLPVLVIGYFADYSIFFAAGLATTIGVFIALFRFIPNVYSGFVPQPSRFTSLKPAMLFSFGNYIALLLYNSIGYIFPIMTLNKLGPEASAYVYIAWFMNGFIIIIADGLTASLFAEGSHSPKELFQQMRHSLMIVILLLLPIIGAVFVLAPWILNIFGPAYAKNGSMLIRILIFSSIPVTLYQYYNTINLVSKKVHLSILQAGTTAAITLFLGQWLLTVYGINGLGIAYVTAHTIVAIAILRPLWQALNSTKPAPAGPD